MWNELINEVATRSGYTKKLTREVLQTAFEAMKDLLVTNGELRIPRFGIFRVKKGGTLKTSRNPKTGEKITYTTKSRVKFRKSQVWDIE